MDLSLSTKEYTDPDLDKDTPMCGSGLIFCLRSISRVHEGKEHVGKPHEPNGMQTYMLRDYWGRCSPDILYLQGGFWDVLDSVAALQFSVLSQHELDRSCTEAKEATDPTVGPESYI